jgi:hypothetical protein
VPVVNTPPELKTIVGDLDKRIRKLEQSPEKRPYAEAYDTTVQTAASATTAYTMSINTLADSNLITLGSNAFTVQRTGVYFIMISIQFYNTDTADSDGEFWLQVDSVDVPWSNSRVSVPGKHGSTSGHILASVNYIAALNAGQSFRFRWEVETTAVGILSETGLISPTRPSIPGVIVTVNEIAW